MENNYARQASITYEVLTDFAEVISISSEWDALLEQSQCNRAFSCSKSFLAISGVLTEVTPMVLIARRGRALAAVMPLVVDAARRRAGFPENVNGYNDIIARDEDIDVISGLFDLALSGSGDYDQLSLQYVRTDSNCMRAARILEPGRDAEQMFVPGTTDANAYVDLSYGYDAYMKTRSKKFRHTLKGDWNRARRMGIVARELKPGELEPERLLETFLQVHLSRFGERSVFKRARFESLHSKLQPALFAEGRLRVFALLNQERIVGMHWCLVGNNSLCGTLCGFLPAVESVSPGSLLFDEAIRQAATEGLEEYDFGYDAHEYKAKWRTNHRKVGQLEFATRTQMRAAKNESQKPLAADSVG